MGAAEAIATPVGRGARGDDRVPPVVVDALLGTAVALAIALIIAAAQGGNRPLAALGGNQPPDLGAYLFAAGFGALMLLRRRTPRALLVLTDAGALRLLHLRLPADRGRPPGGHRAVLRRRRRADAVGRRHGGRGAGGLVLLPVREGAELGVLIGYEAVSNIALIAAATALGYSLRTAASRRPSRPRSPG